MFWCAAVYMTDDVKRKYLLNGVVFVKLARALISQQTLFSLASQ